MVANEKATDSQDRRLEPSALALVAIQCVLAVGSLSFGVFPLLVDGFVRLAHLDARSAGLCITAEMVGQSVGAAGALALVRWGDSRQVVIASLVLMIVGNGLTIGVPSSFRWLLVLRAVAGAGCGLTVICIGLLADYQTSRTTVRHFQRGNTGHLRAVGRGHPVAVSHARGRGRLCGNRGFRGFVPGDDSADSRLSSWADTASEKPPAGKFSLIQVALTCALTVAYFVSLSMFWSYAGEIGIGHHLGVEVVSSAVAQAWLVGGLGGSLAAALAAKRLPMSFIIVVCAVGGAAGTYAAIMVANAVAFSVVLIGFAFFWNVIYPIQMGLFAEVDASGQLAMLAWFVQLIACAIGPALGGYVLQVSSYNVLGFICALGYVLFVCAALALVPAAKQNSAPIG